MEQPAQEKESLAAWLGINRATLAIMIATCGLGLSEEIWHNFLGIELQQKTHDVLHLAIFGLFLNLFEGFGYIIGGTLAHKMGPRIALAFSALPTAIGFAAMLLWPHPAVLVFGAL